MKLKLLGLLTMALHQALLDANSLRNFREFLETYNRISEVCFNRCVVNIHQRTLTQEEMLCCDACTTKNVNVNHKVLSAFMVEQPRMTEKKIQAAQKEAEEMMQKMQEQGQGGVEQQTIQN